MVQAHPKTSQPGSSETMDLAILMTLLRKLLSSVKVTANTPTARNDPDLAIETMAKICLNYHPGLIKRVIERMCVDPKALWPTSGQMNSILHDEAEAEIKKEDVGPGSLARRAHKQFANINGWNYEQIIKHTKEGRAAMRSGKPHTFLMRLADGNQDLPEEMAGWPPNA